MNGSRPRFRVVTLAGTSAIALVIALLTLAGATRSRRPSPAARPTPAPARLGDIRAEPIRAHMRFLADDRLEGRGTGTRGYDIAAAYVTSQLEALGLKPAGKDGSWLQPVPFRRSDVIQRQCALAMGDPKRERPLRYGVDYVMGNDYVRERGEVTAPMAFAGFGVSAPELGYDDYAQVDVRGKVVVLLSGAPPTFPHDQRAFYSKSTIKEENAVGHGAIGIISVRTPVDERRSTWERLVRQSALYGTRWLAPDGTPSHARPELRIGAALQRDAAEALFARGPRPLAAVFATADSGRPQGFDLATSIRARRVCRHQRIESPNVVARLPGSDSKLRDEHVVVTAHLDHLGISAPVQGDSINNGAYDNASGIGILIEMARALARSEPRPKRSVLFVAVTGEEKGLQGSEYFARNPTVPDIIADINLDMFLMLEPLRNVVVYGGEHSSLGPVFERAAGRLGIGVIPDPAPEEVIFIRSDQYSFVQEGIPAAFPTAGGERSRESSDRIQGWLRTIYHSPQDDMSQEFVWSAAVKFAQLNLLATWMVANDPKRPTWNAGDFFGEKFGRGADGAARTATP
jgi:peptidase M28-like protein